MASVIFAIDVGSNAAVAAAPVPPPPEIVTDGVLVYPEPPLMRVRPDIGLPARAVDTVAPVPPPPEIIADGATEYAPPLVRLIPDNGPLKKAVAVCWIRTNASTGYEAL